MVFVMGWHPAPDSEANGGFEWRYNRAEALGELAALVVREALNDGAPQPRCSPHSTCRSRSTTTVRAPTTIWSRRSRIGSTRTCT